MFACVYMHYSEQLPPSPLATHPELLFESGTGCLRVDLMHLLQPHSKVCGGNVRLSTPDQFIQSIVDEHILELEGDESYGASKQA